MNISSQVVDVIDASQRLRPLDEEAVASLTESMRQFGLLQPILVHTPDDEQLILVAGAHRLEAAKRLGWDVIDCIYVDGDAIDCELHEITENLHRAELTVLERSTQTARWVELIAAKQVISDNLSENQTEPVEQPKRKRGRPGNASKAAPEIGANEREVRRSVKIASIAPAAQQAARDAGIDDNQSALLKVAKEATADAQVAKVKEIEAGNANPPIFIGGAQLITRDEDQQEPDRIEIDGEADPVNKWLSDNRAEQIAVVLMEIEDQRKLRRIVSYITDHLKNPDRTWFERRVATGIARIHTVNGHHLSIEAALARLRRPKPEHSWRVEATTTDGRRWINGVRLETEDEAQVYISSFVSFDLESEGYVSAVVIRSDDPPTNSITRRSKRARPTLGFEHGTCGSLVWRPVTISQQSEHSVSLANQQPMPPCIETV